MIINGKFKGEESEFDPKLYLPSTHWDPPMVSNAVEDRLYESKNKVFQDIRIRSKSQVKHKHDENAT